MKPGTGTAENRMKLSVIIPVYNEASTIREIISRVRRVPVGMEKEIIVVDGASTDGTRESLKAEESAPGTLVIYENGREGKGAAVRKGLEKASGDIALIQDADLEVSPEEYPNLLKHIVSGETDVVFGSRFMSGSRFRAASLLANRVLIFLTNLLYGARMTDVLTCYKVFRLEAVKGMEFECRGFDFDTELTVKLLKRGVKITEVPISYSPRTYGDGKKINWKDGFKSVYAVAKNRFS
ncbi:MAG: glycosyltransferase family 2 protein [Elusimicrobiales bacterium]|nr:glycosyltransferase family 2 protein [Elusimicrobiales bacterium]